MNIAIFGLGYVGCVGIGCLAEHGHNMIGVDLEPLKVNLINSGKATIVEKDIDEIILRNFNEKRIRATTDSLDAVKNSDAAIICVGTPNDDNGHLDMSHIYGVAREIGRILKEKNSFYTVAIRSTVMPGTNRKLAEIIQEISGKIMNKDFAVVSNPEFLREGSAVADFFNPPYTVIASESEQGIEVIKKVYAKLKSEVVSPDIGSAELIKFVNNSYHGLKVVFANEVGRVCKLLGVDSRQLMELFVKDKLLNISPYYFKPGFAYGGSCLPKDLKALNSIAHDNYVKIPVMSAIESSNQNHIEFALKLILNKEKRRIGFYGISFKSGTDDLRFSPGLELAERLLGKGYKVTIYDRNVILSRLTGKNKDFLFKRLPHINEILIDHKEIFINDIEVLVIINKDEEINKLLLQAPEGLSVIDLADISTTVKNYEGICW